MVDMQASFAHPNIQYTPSAETLARLQTVNLVAVVGPIGVGKTTLIENATGRDSRLRMVVGDTSRTPRPGEREGIDYHFRTRNKMLERIARREYVQLPPDVTGDLYATAPESYANTGLAVMAVWADALPQFRSLPFKSMQVVFVLPPSLEAWHMRLAARNVPPGILARRLEEAHRSLGWARADPDTLFVINDDLSKAVEDFLQLVHEPIIPTALPRHQQRGRLLATSLLAGLEEMLRHAEAPF